MLVSQSCGGAAAVAGKKPRPVVTDSSTMMAFSGIDSAIAWAIAAWVNAPVGLRQLHQLLRPGIRGLAPTAAASASSAATEFSPVAVKR